MNGFFGCNGFGMDGCHGDYHHHAGFYPPMMHGCHHGFGGMGFYPHRHMHCHHHGCLGGCLLPVLGAVWLISLLVRCLFI